MAVMALMAICVALSQGDIKESKQTRQASLSSSSIPPRRSPRSKRSASCWESWCNWCNWWNWRNMVLYVLPSSSNLLLLLISVTTLLPKESSMRTTIAPLRRKSLWRCCSHFSVAWVPCPLDDMSCFQLIRPRVILCLERVRRCEQFCRRHLCVTTGSLRTGWNFGLFVRVSS